MGIILKAVLIIPQRPYLIEQKALPNLGIMTVSAIFKQFNYDVEVLDFADGLQFIQADIHALTTTTPDFEVSIDILKWLKKHGAQKVIVGGPHATLMPDECLAEGFDAVSVGDGEVTIPKILEGETIAYGWLDEIDKAPHPDRTCIDLKKYQFKIDGQPATSMMTSSSCIWGNCYFCSRPKYKKIRFHSPEWIEDELKQIIESGFNAVMIYDDEFFTYPKRDLEIIRMLGQMGFTWRAFGHSKFILHNKNLLYEASKNGLREVLIGVESGSDRILKIINKGSTVAMNKEAIKFLHSLNIRVKAAMIVMLPGESDVTLNETWAFLEEMEQFISDYDFSMLVPYPGSRIYENPEQFDLQFDKNDIHRPFKGAFKTEKWEPARISTSSLSFEEGLMWRDKLEDRFKNMSVNIP